MGKAKLIPVDGVTGHQNPEGYPFLLIQRPSLFQSGILSSKSDALKTVSEKPYLEMNTEDGHHLKIDDGEMVQVSAPDGRSLQMKVKYSSKLVSGVITTPYPCPIVQERDISPIKIESLRKGGN
jgi:anaerobic selenocysteine-containing dehydrogenase